MNVRYAIPPLRNEASYGIALEPAQVIGRDVVCPIHALPHIFNYEVSKQLLKGNPV